MMNNNINVHEGHRARMRRRFRETGFEGFNDHEILEMLLYYACPRKDMNEIAHELINRFGSIAGVLDADYEELITVKNITENSATLFKMIPKFLPVYYNSRSEGVIYNSCDKLMSLFEPYFVGLTHEEFRLACFDSNLRVLSNILIASGSPSASEFSMRKIIAEVLRTNAVSAVIAHNHPRSDSLASREDQEATRQISFILKHLDVQLVDHIIVIENRSISLRQLGYITIFN